MKKFLFAALAVLCLSVMSAASDDDTILLRANCKGDNEVPPMASTGSASFHATIHPDGSINFTLTYANLSSNLIASHFHFAPTKVGGNVMIFICGGGGQPACPASPSGTITGTITAANVTGPVSQGVNPGDLPTALEAVLEGNSYVNLHTTKFPVGEIRGQVIVRHGDEDGDRR
ncbi:MAG TPA: CHRD domain-containing protein [Candidatus Angelobacter sp.]|nr:CHRD domain-containing protein [Candidatus Angelobacter sp.]